MNKIFRNCCQYIAFIFFFLSGGREGVLVVWQLDTGKKKFKPRLGSPLLYFSASSDPSLSCVRQFLSLFILVLPLISFHALVFPGLHNKFSPSIFNKSLHFLDN